MFLIKKRDILQDPPTRETLKNSISYFYVILIVSGRTSCILYKRKVNLVQSALSRSFTTGNSFMDYH